MDALVQQLQSMIEEEKPRAADVIVWLQGDRYDRAEKVLSLFTAGFARLILLSGNNILIGEGPRPGENNISLVEMKQWLMSHQVPENAMVVDETSMNTREQAIHIVTIARERGWRRLILVGSIQYQLRVFLTFVKAAHELAWDGEIINQPALIRWDSIPSGRNQTATAIFQDDIAKLDRYRDHVATPAEGLTFLSRSAITHSLTFRPATLEDSAVLFDWRNDPTTYEHFFTSQPVTSAEHETWLKSVLADPSRSLFIILAGGTMIGQVRFDVVNGEAEISITIGREHRGHGYGVTAATAAKFFLDKNPHILVVRAQIKSENQASMRAFTKAGYQPVEATGDIKEFRFTRGNSALFQQP